MNTNPPLLSIHTNPPLLSIHTNPPLLSIHTKQVGHAFKTHHGEFSWTTDLPKSSSFYYTPISQGNINLLAWLYTAEGKAGQNIPIGPKQMVDPTIIQSRPITIWVPLYPRVNAQYYIPETYPYLTTKFYHNLYRLPCLPYGTELLIKEILHVNLYCIYRRTAVTTGHRFQDLTRISQTAGNTERCM
jgi:hypothetical protein